MKSRVILTSLSAAAICTGAFSQTITWPDYFIQTVATGLSQPTTMAFIGPNDFLVCEKASGQVKRFLNGVLQGTVLSLPVNSQSERGVLGICVHPDFPMVPQVYIYYSRAATLGGAWLDNRVERFTWNGTTLTLDIPIIVYPSSGTQSNGPNHDGGIIMIGPDRKLYVITGDLNRGRFSNPRIEQNTSTSSTAVADVGGIDRLELDGGTPVDNPFVGHSDPRIRKYFAYGIRNSFGMCYDPLTNKVWFTENGPNIYDEINYCEPGFNSGWLKIMGPDARNATYTENNFTVYNASDLTFLTGSHYRDPEFSILNPNAPTAIRFLSSDKFLPAQRNGMMYADNNVSQLYWFELTPARDSLVLFGGTTDKVADNSAERDLHRVGTGWGVPTDLQIGPDGYLYVVSLSSGAVRRIRPRVENVYPASFTVDAGTLAGGDLNSLRESDDDRLLIRQIFPFTAASPAAGVTLVGTAPVTSTTEITLVVEHSTNAVPASNVSTRVYAFNYQSNTYDLMDSRPGTGSDTQVQITITNSPSNYINQTTREIRMRVYWFDPGTVLFAGWVGRLDQAIWKVRIQ